MANEVVLNALLWDILKEKGIASQAEERNADGSKTDIRCTIGDCIVAVEAEHGVSAAKKRSANQDADAKLARNVCHVAIAVAYPTQCNTRDDLLNSDLLVNVRTPGYQPEARQTKWTAVKGGDFADFIRQAPNELGSPETLAKVANAAINKAAGHFNETQQRAIMGNIGAAAANTNIKGLMTDLLTAIMFHTRLDTIRHQIEPTTDARQDGHAFYGGPWPPPSVDECLQDRDGIVKNFHTAHDTWLAVDYKHIMEWSCAILHALPKSPNSNTAVKIIADAAMAIQSASGNQHHDLVGITFCQSVETAKSDGSMYTTIPAATMLTGLLFNDAGIDWTDFEQVTRLRIVDFACGTGTLLIAAANYILQHENTGRREQVAQALLEQMLYGFDINNRAIFQTATGIGMIAPSIAFRNMHLYSLILDIDPRDGNAKLGALEMLEGIVQPSLNPRPATGTRIDSAPAPIETEKFTVCIMNPPFTANKKRHHQLSPGVRAALHSREQELYAGTGIPHTSNANGFLALAEKHLDAQSGRLGFVLPTATATNPSALPTRRLLAERFHIKYLVVSYDPKRIYQSGNTDIGEMLVVMERKRPGPQPPTTVVKLTVNPDTASAAAACASSILNEQTEAHEWGIVDYIDAAAIAAGNWDAVQFASNELYRIAAHELWDSALENQVGITTISRRIPENARKCHQDDAHATPALYDHKVTHCDRMEVGPDAWVCPQKGNTRAAKYLNRKHTLKLPTRINLPTVKNMALRTSEPTVSVAWQNGIPVPAQCGPHNPVDVEKALTVILNSTPGKIGMLRVRSFKKPAYPNFGIEGLLRIPMPRIADLKPEQVQGLAAAYDELAGQERKSLPEAHHCPVQLAIDGAVCEYLGFDAALCQTARHLLAQEPMVTGRRYEYPPPGDASAQLTPEQRQILARTERKVAALGEQNRALLAEFHQLTGNRYVPERQRRL